MYKIITTVLLTTFLSGCATVNKIKDYWPRDHDPALVSMYINLEKELEKLSCDNQDKFYVSIEIADWINRYSEFRNDPQKVATKNVRDNLEKASKSSPAACKSYVTLAKINIDLIKDSWSKR